MFIEVLQDTQDETLHFCILPSSYTKPLVDEFLISGTHVIGEFFQSISLKMKDNSLLVVKKLI